MSARQMIGASVVALLMAVAPAALRSAGPSFRPDTTVSSSTLEGWHTLGSAEWRAGGGALVGTPGSGGGGWLVLDRSLQDVGFYASFLCAAGCETGVLLRAEKTADGLKGVYVALNEKELRSYGVTIDSNGRMLQRTPLRSGGGQIRIAPPAASNALIVT